MPKRKVRAWGFQRDGAHPLWAKVEDWLADNRRHGRSPAEWQDLAKAWKMAPQTLSDWKDAGKLPTLDQGVWLAARMGSTIPDLLEPAASLGATKPADQAIRDWMAALPPTVREVIARGVKANPGAAARILAGLDPSASLPG